MLEIAESNLQLSVQWTGVFTSGGRKESRNPK